MSQYIVTAVKSNQQGLLLKINQAKKIQADPLLLNARTKSYSPKSLRRNMLDILVASFIRKKYGSLYHVTICFKIFPIKTVN